MPAKIVITGVSGTLGQLLADRLRPRNRVVGLARNPPAMSRGIEFAPVDLAHPDGLQDILADASTIVHCAGGASGDDRLSANLLGAIDRRSAPHVIYISVVGADRVPVVSRLDRAMFGYYAAKWKSEQLVSGSSLPWTTVRATQFHELLLKMCGAMAGLPIIPLPAGMKFQPVAASHVADSMVGLIEGRPRGMVDPIAGPEVLDMETIMKTYLKAMGKHRPIISIPMMGGAARALRSGANLEPDHAVGTETWLEAVSDHFQAAPQAERNQNGR